MDEYVCIYDNGRALKHCTKLTSDTCDNARLKFIEYLKTKDILTIDSKKLFLINYSYLGSI